ncbi:MAG: squalene synthase HpnC [Acidimicrobiales bacterium]
MSTAMLDQLPDAETVLKKAPAENFPVALRILPALDRENLLAVYGYARLVDEIGDELAGGQTSRLGALDLAEAELDLAFAGTATHPTFQRLGVVIERCHLERRPFVDLIDANRMDQRVTSYDSFEQLLGYCKLSANPVGRLVLAIFGEKSPQNEELSDLVCTGLQLVEHLQDVVEDAARGRVYLPREDMERFSVPRDFFEAVAVVGSVPTGFRRLMAFEVSRARSMLAAGSELVGLVTDAKAAVAIAGFTGGGLAQLAAIERAGYDVVNRQLKASRSLVAAHVVGLLARRHQSRHARVSGGEN